MARRRHTLEKKTEFVEVNVCVDLLVVFSEAQQQLVVKTLEVLPEQRAQFNLCLALKGR